MSKPKIRPKRKTHPFPVIERVKRSEKGARMVEFAANAADSAGDEIDGFMVLAWDVRGHYWTGHQLGGLCGMLVTALVSEYTRREMATRQEVIRVLREAEES